MAERIEAVTPSGIRDATGVERPADAIVLATGFASHDFVAPMEIAGRGGRTLAEEWGEVARAYLGLSVPGFPNMFLLYGPNTNGGSGSVVNTLECGIGHVLAALREMERARGRGGSRSGPRRPRTSTASCAPPSPKPSGTAAARNWYVDENGNDPSNWPWAWSAYRRRTERARAGRLRAGRQTR